MGTDYTSNEVAQITGKSIKTVNRYLNKGLLIGYKCGGTWLIPEEALIQFYKWSNKKLMKEVQEQE